MTDIVQLLQDVRDEMPTASREQIMTEVTYRLMRAVEDE